MIKEKVNCIISKLSLTDEQVCENLSLKSDLGFDSLRMVELIVALEEAFNIEIDESDLDPDQFNIVADLSMLIEKYVEVA